MKTQIAIKYVQQHGFNAFEIHDGAVVVEIPWHSETSNGVHQIVCDTFRDVQIALGY